MLWLAAKLLAHGADGCRADAARRAAPSRMSERDHALPGIIEQQGSAVGRGHGERDAATPCDDGICLAARPGCPDQLALADHIGAMGPVVSPVVPLVAI